MLSAEEIVALGDGRLVLDCPSMSLTKNTEMGLARFEGPGEIRQGEDGNYQFKVYAKDPENLLTFERLCPSIAIGEIIPPSEYYTLACKDLSQRDWTSERVLIDFSRTFGQPDVLINGTIYQLTSKTPVFPPNLSPPPFDWLRLRFFPSFDFPGNAVSEESVVVAGKRTRGRIARNIGQFKTCGCSVTLSKASDRAALVEVQSGHSPLKESFGDRLTEAIEFALGQRIGWSVLEARSGNDETIVLRTSPIRDERGRARPPLQYGPSLEAIDVYRIADCYLRFVVNDPVKLGARHRLSAIVRFINASRSASIDIEALVLSVAVEGILKTLYHDVGKPGSEDLAQIEKAMQLLEGADLAAGTKERIKGALGGMREASAKDRLSSLAKQGVIREPDVKAWQKLRHSHAHFRQTAPEERQSVLDLIYKVYVLYHCLVFHLIGYRGAFTDYGSRGWPKEDHPPIAALSEPR